MRGMFLWLDFHLAEVVLGMALDVTYVLWGPAFKEQRQGFHSVLPHGSFSSNPSNLAFSHSSVAVTVGQSALLRRRCWPRNLAWMETWWV